MVMAQDEKCKLLAQFLGFRGWAGNDMGKVHCKREYVLFNKKDPPIQREFSMAVTPESSDHLVAHGFPVFLDS